MPNPFYYLIHEPNIQWIKVEDACWGETLKDSKFFKGQTDNHKKYSSSTSRVELTKNKTRRNWNLREPTKKKSYKWWYRKKIPVLLWRPPGSFLQERPAKSLSSVRPLSLYPSVLLPPPEKKKPLQNISFSCLFSCLPQQATTCSATPSHLAAWEQPHLRGLPKDSKNNHKR